MLASADDTSVGRHSGGSWHARLKLRFTHSGGRTRMRREGGQGPLYVQKPFYPEGAACHLYLLHPPGGLVGGDELEVIVQLERGAHVLLTTPAATKFYRSAGQFATQQHTFYLDSGSWLEWLPQESLLFAGARARSSTQVYLAPDCRFIGWEQVCLGRPAALEDFTWGELDQRLGLYISEDRFNGSNAVCTPVLLERNCWRAADPVMGARWGLAGHTVAATLYATPVDPEAIPLVQRKLDDMLHRQAAGVSPELLAALTQVSGVLVARVLGYDAEAVRQMLQALWQQLRPIVLGCNACRPRIWNT